MIFFHPFRGWGQEIPVSTEQQFENQPMPARVKPKMIPICRSWNDSDKNPINLNTADADELKQLRIITDLQVANLLLTGIYLENLSAFMNYRQYQHGI